jgi:hypothetical protein
MEPTKKLLDGTYLNDKFTLSNLWLLYEEVTEIKVEIETLKDCAIELRKVDELKEIESDLYYINRNINLIEEIIEIKQIDIFTFTRYGEICLN